MKTSITYKVIHFLESYCKGNCPLLLGFSGGPDSLTLLHILLRWKQESRAKLHLAHVDHGWRPESFLEAQLLRAKAEEWKLPFHLKTLSPTEMKGNLEAECRKQRYEFFAEIYHRENCQALLLGHHAQDQMETVLKRFLEGMSLPLLSGMTQRREMLGMQVWRPLLKIPKEEIEAYILEQGLCPIYDPSNNNPRFLRGRIRTEILPWLTAQFGKQVASSISRISEEAAELKHFMDNHLAKFIAQIVVSPYGSMLDLSAICPESSLELKYLLRKLAEIQSVSIPHAVIENASELIRQKTSGHRLACKGVNIEIDRGRIFLYTQPFPKIEVSRLEDKEVSHPTSWKEAWKGEGVVSLPAGEYTIGPPKMNARCLAGPMLGKWWTDHKVPAFLRNLIPVIYRDNCVAHEFLTGRLQEPGLSPKVQVQLRVKDWKDDKDIKGF